MRYLRTVHLSISCILITSSIKTTKVMTSSCREKSSWTIRITCQITPSQSFSLVIIAIQIAIIHHNNKIIMCRFQSHNISCSQLSLQNQIIISNSMNPTTLSEPLRRLDMQVIQNNVSKLVLTLWRMPLLEADSK